MKNLRGYPVKESGAVAGVRISTETRTERMEIRLPSSLYRKLKLEALRRDCTLTALTIEALNRQLGIAAPQAHEGTLASKMAAYIDRTFNPTIRDLQRRFGLSKDGVYDVHYKHLQKLGYRQSSRTSKSGRITDALAVPMSHPWSQAKKVEALRRMGMDKDGKPLVRNSHL